MTFIYKIQALSVCYMNCRHAEGSSCCFYFKSYIPVKRMNILCCAILMLLGKMRSRSCLRLQRQERIVQCAVVTVDRLESQMTKHTPWGLKTYILINIIHRYGDQGTNHTVNKTVLNNPKYWAGESYLSLILWFLLLWWQPCTLLFFVFVFLRNYEWTTLHAQHSQLHDIVSQDGFLNIPEGAPSGTGQVFLGHVIVEAGSSAAAQSRCSSVCCCTQVVTNAHYT